MADLSPIGMLAMHSGATAATGGQLQSDDEAPGVKCPYMVLKLANLGLRSIRKADEQINRQVVAVYTHAVLSLQKKCSHDFISVLKGSRAYDDVKATLVIRCLLHVWHVDHCSEAGRAPASQDQAFN